MLGTMQNWPLLVHKLIDHAATVYPHRDVVTQTVEGPLHRTTWREVRRRSAQVASCLASLGIRRGDRVATLAWNTYRHIECWYGISGLGGIAHTVNPRLFRDQIVFILNHAEDRVLFFDITFADLIASIAPDLRTVEHFIALTDAGHMPPAVPQALCYEDLIESGSPDFPWAALDENDPAGLCYTSGTTGNPKGVLYSHRSNVLHAWNASQVDSLGLSSRSTVLPIVPMFHANAWGVPYAAALTGAKVVMAGPYSDAPTLHRLIISEGVTLSLAVPTVWLAFAQHLEEAGRGIGRLERIMIGGSAAPRALIERLEAFGATVMHAWGATEMSPIGSLGMLCQTALDESRDRQLDRKCTQGRAPFGVEMAVVDDAGKRQAQDGRSFGHLMVRGPWIVGEYFRGDGGVILDADGWFDTGDIATIDPLGYMQITDRAKDVIKSGGEWISSIELENAAVGCEGVAEAAVIGIPHPRWDERPLLIVVPRSGATVTAAALKEYLATRVAKWWLPDDIVFVPELPHTATGKIQKTALRERWAAGELTPTPR